MSTAHNLLTTIAPLLTLTAALLLATRRRVVREFQNRRAVNAQTAIPFAPSSPLKAWWLERLRNAGVLRPEAGGRFWLDESSWMRYQATRRRRAMMAVAIVVLAMLALAVLDRF